MIEVKSIKEVRRSRQSQLSDRAARVIFLVCAILLVAVIISIFWFIGSNAFRIFSEGVSGRDFFLVDNWDPNDDPGTYGAGGLIVGSVVITIFSVIITTPLAFGMALFLTEVAPRRIARLIQPLVEIFSGMPSVVIGFLGLVLLVPFLKDLAAPITGHSPLGGFGWAAAILVLVVMILPTITSVSIDALRAVPEGVREASLALGSTKWQTMWRAIIPAATTGLATAVILGMARAIGETLAVSIVLQGTNLPKNLFSLQAFFQPNVNITNAIVAGFGDASGTALDAFWTLAFILLVISFLFICVSRYLASRSVYK